jgi:hypothetical protein
MLENANRIFVVFTYFDPKKKTKSSHHKTSAISLRFFLVQYYLLTAQYLTLDES